jgi:hypothetical protein
MKYDKGKVDEMVLALLYLTTHDNGTRAWKGMDWEAMDRLHDKGFIGNPKTRAKSVTLTEKGRKLSEQFFKKNFGLAS